MKHESAQQLPLRELAAQAFSRAAGAPLISGNRVRLLEDAGQNYPAWLEAIAGAKHHVHAEMYFFSEDEGGGEFADVLISRARAGVQVRLVYDWLGAFSRASRSFWNFLGEGGVQVRCYNPLQLDSPFGWISRDHRKLLTVDGEVGFVSGLCVSSLWRGDPSRGIAPWRDTGVEIRGPAVAEIERAFAGTWASLGEPAPLDSLVAAPPAGTVSLRIVATEPSTAGMLRPDQLIPA